MEEKKIPRRQSKQDLENALLRKLQEWQNEGSTPEEAVERLSIKQYDFLINRNINLDNLLLTPQQLQAVQIITKAPRPSGLVYKKKYPENKQNLYNNLLDFLKTQGAEIAAKEKENYRDIDFTIAEIAYKIVLSNPRVKKNE